MKAILIRSTACTITEVEYDGLRDLQRFVGGFIEHAKTWPDTGDTLYVDEEGKLKGKSAGFVLPGMSDIFVGDAIVVGRETGEVTPGMDAVTAPPTITVGQLGSLLMWAHYMGARVP